MRTLFVAVLLLASSLFLAGCMSSGNGGADVDVGPEEAAIVTSKGTILLAFYCDAAPVTVENFRQYAEDDFYQGTIFHRIIEDFMIQGGGFREDGSRKTPRDPIPLEYEMPNERGTIAMARTNDPNSATSQFFINTDDNTRSLGPGQNGPGYAVFGRVIDGMDVVDAIAAVRVEQQEGSNEVSRPVDPPVIRDVVVGPGCEEEDVEPTYGVEAGLIQNTVDSEGVWHTDISAETDYIPFYILNLGNQDDSFTAKVESPVEWDISVKPGIIELAKNTGGKGSNYPYAAAGHLVVKTVDGFEGATDANVTLTFQSDTVPEETAVLQIRLHVEEKMHSRVSAPGDSIAVDYRGTLDDGEVFDEGSLPVPPQMPELHVAGQETVKGFSYGLMGIHIGETVDIRFPPELGYGYSGGPDPGGWLNFEITLKKMN